MTYRMTDAQREVFDECVLAAVADGCRFVVDITERATERMKRHADEVIRAAARRHDVNHHVRSALERLRKKNVIVNGEQEGKVMPWLLAPRS